MTITTLKEVTDTRSILAGSISDRVPTDDAVDISVLTGFEDEHDDGQPDLVVELINLYLDDVPQKLKEIRDAILLNDINLIRGTAHGLKGSSSSLGAFKMAALCDGLEASASSLSADSFNMLLTSIEQQFERVRLVFVAERQKRSQEAGKQ